ncbi:MAG: hydrolase [Hyphomicrobiales bacterium]|nr:hydrolase [Hyphomicrobiales bacterium]
MRFRLKSGHALGYLPSGRGETTLVMLHPIGVRAQVWQALAAELASEYRVLAADAPGHGESDVPSGPMSIGDMAASVQELLEAIGGDRIVPIGCSMGSSMAAALAAAMSPSGKIAALVLSNSSYQPSAERGTAHIQRAEAAKLGMPNVLETTLNRWFSAEVLATRPEMVAEVARWLLAGDPVVHARCWAALGNFSYEPLLPALTMPTLAIGGELDKAARPMATRALAEALPAGSYVEIAGAGHLSPLERPAEFAAVLRKFLRDHLGAS